MRNSILRHRTLPRSPAAAHPASSGMRKHNAITMSQREWMVEGDVSGARVSPSLPLVVACIADPWTRGPQRVLGMEEFDGKTEYGLEDIRNILSGPPLAPAALRRSRALCALVSLVSDPPVPRMPL